ncbi:MAG: hypothetical protein WC661_17345 [Opitutaceae bacterium]
MDSPTPSFTKIHATTPAATSTPPASLHVASQPSAACPASIAAPTSNGVHNAHASTNHGTKFAIGTRRIPAATYVGSRMPGTNRLTKINQPPLCVNQRAARSTASFETHDLSGHEAKALRPPHRPAATSSRSPTKIPVKHASTTGPNASLPAATSKPPPIHARSSLTSVPSASRASIATTLSVLEYASSVKRPAGHHRVAAKARSTTRRSIPEKIFFMTVQNQ